MRQKSSPKSENKKGNANKAMDNASTNGKYQNGLPEKQQKGQSDDKPSYLEIFFTEQLKDIYYAEKKITDGLKVMQQAATTDELKDAFQEHGMQTQKHIKRLEKVFTSLGKNPEGKKCEAIEGILKEAESIIEETKEGSMTRDAALIFAAQKVEHYEIASYGGLIQFAITLGLHEEADILDRTLREEEETDMLLTEIAENDINLGAEQEGVEYSWGKKNQSVNA
jgi:ferritin-like metal-binding protein YciE